MINDVDRMMICSVCGADACFGFNVDIESIRMGYVGDWRCAEHHSTRKNRYTREEWADARAKGKLYPDPASPEGEWKKLGDIVASIKIKIDEAA